MAQNIDINNIESEYLKARIEAIQAKTSLDEEEKLERSLKVIRQYIIATVLLRSFLSLFTLFAIWPIYDHWALKNGRESRWFRLKESEVLKEANASESSQDEEESQLENQVDSEDSSTSKKEEESESAKPRNPSNEEDSKSPAVQNSSVEEEPSEAAKNSAVKLFINKKADQRQFATWYSSDTSRLLLNMPRNWSQSIRVQFNDGDQDANTDSFVLQLSQLMKMSDEFKRPAIFVAKSPGASIHFIAGLYFDNKVLLIDPMGSKEDLGEIFTQIKTENAMLSVFLSKTIIQHDPEEDGFEQTVSCGPIVSELVMHISNTMTREQLEDFFATLESDTVDIKPLLPGSLVALVDEKEESPYEEMVLALRAKHHDMLGDIPPEKDAEAYLENLDNAPAQIVFNHIVLTQSDTNDMVIREAYNKLATEIGCPSKRDHLQIVTNFNDCDYGDLPKLGSGTSSDIVKFEAKDQCLAVKTFKKRAVKNFHRECEILFIIKHENIVQYFYCGNYQSVFNYIALEYAELGDLGSVIENSAKFAPPWKIKFKMARDIACGLEYLHDVAKIIHRDLKTDNVLLTWNQGEFRAKISDFDLSISSLNYKFGPVGTPLYLPPEIYAKFYPGLAKHGDIQADVHSEKSDVYSYGVVLWEIGAWVQVDGHHHKNQKSYGAHILSGSRIEKPEAVNHPGLAVLVAKCWNNRHKERPTAHEVLEAVSGLTC